MSKPANTTDKQSESPSGKAGTVKDSAQQIWLAGLGAFAKAQEEGSKVFEALVKEGLGMQRKTQAAATEATSKMASMANLTNIGGGLGARPTGPWDKLENIFEDRVAKAMSKLGAPSAADFEALTARIDELSRQVQALSRPAAAKAAPQKPAPAEAASKAPIKRPRKAASPKG